MTTHHPAAVIVLAAGQGTRMKSDLPKVLHTIGGRSLVGHAIRAARHVEPEHLAVVVRHERDRVVEHITAIDPAAVIADQDEIPGTGRACECGLDSLPADLEGTVLVTMGDVPLLTGDTLAELTRIHEEAGAAVTLLSGILEDAGSYGRVVRDAEGRLERIMEFKDALARREAGDPDYSHVVDITEFNSGIYAFDARVLREALAGLGTDNAQGEKYLTDVIAVARDQGRTVQAHVLEDLWQTEGINDKAQLAVLARVLNERVVERLMKEDGAIVVDPATTWVDDEVRVGRDTVIRPNTQLLGATTIGAGAVIGPDVTISDSEVGDGAHVRRAELDTARVGPGATVGPFSYLRPGTVLEQDAKVGGFVETKNAHIGAGAKVPHLTYCGDATVEEGANIGAGTIFANYDGVAKHRTTVGRHSFVGSNSVLVAPVTIAPGAYVAAGSALSGDVDAGQIAVARGRQRNVDGWVARRRAGTPTAQAAEEARQGRGETTDQQSTDPSSPATDKES